MADIRQQILDFVKKRGPSTPIEVAIGTGLNSLFVSAILSDKDISKHLQRSCIKIGSSHLYFTAEQKQKARLKIFSLLDDDQKKVLKQLESKKVLLEGDEEEKYISDYGDFFNEFTFGDRRAWYWFDLDGEKALKILESRLRASSQVSEARRKPLAAPSRPAVSMRNSVKKKPRKKASKSRAKKGKKKSSKARKKRAMVSW